ncbi:MULTISPECIES: hypothetical protein [Sphingobacterium]|uniref:hypothetical protein n=1 Tax=Sphingobacterium TaxID=28453 RepID=UPI0013DAD314|nr:MULTISPECIES: hypothetical protein [unclassified Sphingobacterium]
MEKHRIYTFLEEIRVNIAKDVNPLAVKEAYEMVDAVIKEQDFYHHTPYFLSEWIVLKGQVLRNDSESLGYFDRFLDNIMYDSATGVYEAFVFQKAKV